MDKSPYCPNCHELNGPEPTVWEDPVLSSDGDIGPLMRSVKRMEEVNNQARKTESCAVWGTIIGLGVYALLFLSLYFWSC